MANEPKPSRLEQMKRNIRLIPRMRKMRDKGMTHKAIAAVVGLSRSRVQKMLAGAE